MSDSLVYNAGWEMGRKQGLREAADEIERLRVEVAQGAQWRREGEAELRAEIERLRMALDAHCRPCLGLASTEELQQELSARTGASRAPDYRTIGDLDGYRKAHGLLPMRRALEGK